MAREYGKPDLEAVPSTIVHGERYSDVGNARRFVRLFGESSRWIPEVGWHIHGGTRWQRDDDGEMVRRAKATTQAIIDNSKDFPADARAEAVKFALRSEQAPRLMAMLELAKSEKGISLPYRELDADPWLVGVQRGAVDLRTGKFVLPPRDAYLSRRLGTEHNPHAKCPTWCSFLDRITGGDVALVEFLQRCIGYTLTGSIREQCFFICHGPGANGKSVLLRVIRLLLGDYGADAAVDTFLDRGRRDSSNDLARLAQLRYVCASELDEGKALAEGLVKTITGGEAISARFLFREYFEFVPTFKLWMACNHKPRVSGDDNAIWRRIRLLPLRITIPPAEQDRDLLEKLRAELPGILTWAITGALAWQRDGLEVPAAVDAATQEYRAESDALGEWIDERCVLSPGASVQAMTLYKDYKTFAEDRGSRSLNMKRWAQRMATRDDIHREKGAYVHYRGIALRDGCDSRDQFSVTSPYTPTRGELLQKGHEGLHGHNGDD